MVAGEWGYIQSTASRECKWKEAERFKTSKKNVWNFHCAIFFLALLFRPSSLVPPLSCSLFMKYHSSTYPSAFRERVASYYHAHLASTSLRSVSRLFDLKGTGNTVKRWYHIWLKKNHEIKNKPKKGRTPILTRSQIDKYIARPIKEKNKKAEPVNYRMLLPQVRAKTKTQISLRTLQKYGKEKKGIKWKTVKKRTYHERRSAHTQ